MFFQSNKQEGEATPDPKNPAQLKTALVFAGLYALILVLIVYAKRYFGTEGLYVVSILSGLTDVDAITLSMANTIKNEGISPQEGWRYILVAALSNLSFKGGMVVALGHAKLRKSVLPAFLLTLIAGILVVIFW
jgi:uncharacterized membrane protein (DUF4010 family)